MDITMIATGAFRETGASFFFIPKGALTHHLRSRQWYPSRWSGRALCEADCALFGERQTMPPSQRASVVIACTAGRSVFARFAASLQTVVLCRDNLPSACENLPPAALSQLWTMLPGTVHFGALYPDRRTDQRKGQRTEHPAFREESNAGAQYLKAP